MATELIELGDGLLVEVHAAQDRGPRALSASAAERVEGALDEARELLLKATQPVAEAWDDLNEKLKVDKVEIHLALGFEAQGNLFLVKGTGNANITFKLTVSPK